jgi:hypothetical protein
MKILSNLLVPVVAGDFAVGIIVQAGAHDEGSQTSTDPHGSELIASGTETSPTRAIAVRPVNTF